MVLAGPFGGRDSIGGGRPGEEPFLPRNQVMRRRRGGEPFNEAAIAENKRITRIDISAGPCRDMYNHIFI